MWWMVLKEHEVRSDNSQVISVSYPIQSSHVNVILAPPFGLMKTALSEPPPRVVFRSLEVYLCFLTQMSCLTRLRRLFHSSKSHLTSKIPDCISVKLPYIASKKFTMAAESGADSEGEIQKNEWGRDSTGNTKYSTKGTNEWGVNTKDSTGSGRGRPMGVWVLHINHTSLNYILHIANLILHQW